jgi:signal transduction histidine kinase
VSGDQFLAYLTWAVFLALFALVLRMALRQPLWANLNLLLFFAMPAAIIGIGIAAALGLVQPGPIPNAVNTSLLLTSAYAMLRLADDYTTAPRWLLRLAGPALALLIILSFVFAPPRPPWIGLAHLLFFVGLELYAAVAFVRAARRTVGVTGRRMRAVALGALLFGLTLVAVAASSSYSWLDQVATSLALASAVSYFIGFAPPLFLRRSWQEPELRAFLATANRLARPTSGSLELQELERASAAALGTHGARILCWDERRQQLDPAGDGESEPASPDIAAAIGRAFEDQEPQFFSYRIGRARPGTGPRALLAAPITTSSERYGVLLLHTRHAPLVVAEDIELAELVAGQIAATFEARALAEELARTQAAAEAGRLKEDFLSAAAHDLKTPLTTVLGQAQRIQRLMRTNPAAAPYLPGVGLIVQETQRLRHIVNELLDVSQAERGQLLGDHERLDLGELLQQLLPRFNSPRHRFVIEADPGLVGRYDPQRMRQLIENLLDNAVLYSPEGGTVQISLRRQGAYALLTVSDEGIGIPGEDLPRIFERFFRGSNVDDRHYAGMGLSLFICRAIVEQHGGRIRATSNLGKGTSFHVTLPLEIEELHNVAA